MDSNVFVFIHLELSGYFKVGLVTDSQLEGADFRPINQDNVRTAGRLENRDDGIPFCRRKVYVELLAIRFHRSKPGRDEKEYSVMATGVSLEACRS